MASTMDPRVTHSQRAAFLKCPRLHRWQYVDRLRPLKSAKALRMGSAVHVALEHWGRNPGDKINACGVMAEDWYRSTRLDEGRDEYELAAIRAMVMGYTWRWSKQPWDLVHIEQAVVAPGSPWSMAGKIDGIVRMPTGGHAILEYKTTSYDLHPESMLWQQYEMSPQPVSYMHLAQQLGVEVVGVIYDVLRKPTQKPRMIPQLDEDGLKVVRNPDGSRALTKAGKPRQVPEKDTDQVLIAELETATEYGGRVLSEMMHDPDTYFARRQIPVTQRQRNSVRIDVADTHALIDHCLRTDAWPRNTQQCFNYGGGCPYLSLCRSDYHPDIDPIPDGFHVVDDPHEELAQ